MSNMIERLTINVRLRFGLDVLTTQIGLDRMIQNAEGMELFLKKHYPGITYYIGKCGKNPSVPRDVHLWSNASYIYIPFKNWFNDEFPSFSIDEPESQVPQIAAKESRESNFGNVVLLGVTDMGRARRLLNLLGSGVS